MRGREGGQGRRRRGDKRTGREGGNDSGKEGRRETGNRRRITGYERLEEERERGGKTGEVKEAREH